MGQEKRVDYRFKIMYAVGIIMVVSYHCYGGPFSLLSQWFPFSVITLPIFIFSSGYFYRSSAEDNLPRYYLKKTLSLIVPLYVYTVIYGLFVQITRKFGYTIGGDFTLTNVLIEPIKNGHEFMYNLGSWFLVPLFMVEVFNVTVRRLVKLILPNVSEWVFFVINIALGIFGNQLACMGYYNDWWLVLVRFLFFLQFYELGIIYRSKLEKFDKKIPDFWFLAVVFIIDYIIIYHYGRTLDYSTAWCNNFTEGPVMPLVAGTLGIATWLRISTMLEPAIGRNKYLNLVADNTFSIMMNHVLGIMIMKWIFGLISLVYDGYADFYWEGLKTELMYFYLPRDITHTLLLYTASGIVFPILLQKGIDAVKRLTFQRIRNGEATTPAKRPVRRVRRRSRRED